MSVTVTTNNQDEATYPTAEKWVIDDEDRLHIVGPKGNLASYARGVWAFVASGSLDDRPVPSQPITVSYGVGVIGEPDEVQKRADAVAARMTESIRNFL